MYLYKQKIEITFEKNYYSFILRKARNYLHKVNYTDVINFMV